MTHRPEPVSEETLAEAAERTAENLQRLIDRLNEYVKNEAPAQRIDRRLGRVPDPADLAKRRGGRW